MADDQVQPPTATPSPGDDRDIRVPEPRLRRRTPVRSIVFSLFGTLFALVLIASAVAIWGYKQSQAPGPLTQSRTVVIDRGTGNEDVAALLEKEGVIDNAREFLALIWLTRPHAPVIKAGEYEFSPRISMRDALALIRSGHVVTYKLTLPEGWTSARILKRIREQPTLAGEVTRPVPEGSILPDTYLYQRGTSRDDLIARMQAARDRLLKDLWARRAGGLPLKTPEEAVILASIVEKETGLAEERPRVAAVFLNRLRKHMRLQSDPTIIYGITEGKSRLDRPLRRSDIAEKTPYNTYQINGLPPTPIANPGRDALAAVLNPIKSDELYFVADGTGGHVFASNIKEHRANVKHWRQVERDQRDAAAQDSSAPDASGAAPVDAAQRPSSAPDRQAAEAAAPATAEAPPNPAEQATATAEATPKPAEQATATAEATPKPAEQATATAEATPKPAEQATATAEAPKPAEPAADAHAAAAVPSDLAVPSAAAPKPANGMPEFAEIARVEPGKIVRIAGRLVPFPRPRPPR